MVRYGYRGIAAHPLSVRSVSMFWLWREPLARLASKSFNRPPTPPPRPSPAWQQTRVRTKRQGTAALCLGT